MEIKLLKLCVENFKGLERVGMDFGGQPCTVCGDNATGKTSLYDALLWLLFDKDSHDQKNFEIKPLGPDGLVKDHGAITSVEAELSADGREVTFRREFRESWSTRRGSVEKAFDGNTNDYFVDGVPCKKYEYERRLSEIISEDTFRLLTGVTYFCAGMAWKDRRRVLFDVCGTTTEQDILAQEPAFTQLAAACGPLCVDDLKRKLLAERKGLTGTRDEIPARLDECKKAVDDLKGIDFAAIRSERDSRAEKRDKLAGELMKLEHNSLLDAKTNERDALKNQLAALENENRQYRASQTTPDAARAQLLREGQTIRDREAAWTADKNSADRAAVGYESEIECSRSRWKAENARSYTGGTCPTCGQALAGAALQTAAARFEKQKAELLAAIVRDSEITKQKAAHEREHSADLAGKIAEADRRISEIETQLQTMPEKKNDNLADLEGYTERRAQLEARISAVDAEIYGLSAESGTIRESTRREIVALDGEIKAIETTLGRETVLQYTQERMSKLRSQAAEAAAKLEKLDSLLSQIDEFTRYKVQFIEKSVNEHFRLARFRLFTEQINGGLADCCEVTYDGVPYGSLNNGARINVGMDVIEAFSKHYGVRVPLFVDNAESVTRLHGIDTQIIRLEVSEQDKELRCEAWA